MRHERDRGKLKFYKNEYYTFDLARKAFEAQQESHAREINQRDTLIKELSDQNKHLSELNQTQEHLIA
jgi:hypothetical protein